jgi:hypothetical protein
MSIIPGTMPPTSLGPKARAYLRKRTIQAINLGIKQRSDMREI